MKELSKLIMYNKIEGYSKAMQIAKVLERSVIIVTQTDNAVGAKNLTN